MDWYDDEGDYCNVTKAKDCHDSINAQHCHTEQSEVSCLLLGKIRPQAQDDEGDYCNVRNL